MRLFPSFSPSPCPPPSLSSSPLASARSVRFLSPSLPLSAGRFVLFRRSSRLFLSVACVASRRVSSGWRLSSRPSSSPFSGSELARFFHGGSLGCGRDARAFGARRSALGVSVSGPPPGRSAVVVWRDPFLNSIQTAVSFRRRVVLGAIAPRRSGTVLVSIVRFFPSAVAIGRSSRCGRAHRLASSSSPRLPFGSRAGCRGDAAGRFHEVGLNLRALLDGRWSIARSVVTLPARDVLESCSVVN